MTGSPGAPGELRAWRFARHRSQIAVELAGVGLALFVYVVGCAW